MTRQQLGLALRDLGELAFEGFGNTGVKRASRLAQQRAICRVLHQGMFEQVPRIRRQTLSEQQTSLNETVERPKPMPQRHRSAGLHVRLCCRPRHPGARIAGGIGLLNDGTVVKPVRTRIAAAGADHNR
jgi:hypothetical protein